MATATYTRRTPEQGVLYQAFDREWPIIRAASRAANDGGGLPDFIELAVDHFLRCGILGHGFVHAKCESCEQSIVVAFSCKQRGICNSCDGKRMTEIAAHLIDEVIPAVPVRQWVLTFPHDVRYLLAWNSEPALCAAAGRVWWRLAGAGGGSA